MADLFNKKFNDNYKPKRKELKKEENLFGLTGEVEVIGMREGEIFSRSKHNALINGSKTSIIRLIGQQTSDLAGTIDPTQYAITKMRFGQGVHTTHVYNEELYYDITEASSRPFTGDTSSGNYSGLEGTDFNTTPAVFLTGFNIQSQTATRSIVTLDLGLTRPPSQGTLKVEFYKDSNTTLVETLQWTNATGYHRAGTKPTGIQRHIGADPNINFITYTDTPVTDNTLTALTPATDSTLTVVKYNSATGTWGLEFEVQDGGTGAAPADYGTFDTVRAYYYIGQENIINSIVPVTGVNNPVGGLDLATRYNGSADHFGVGVNVKYTNVIGGRPVDDNSVRFAVLLDTDSGNNNTTSPSNVSYTEAFLMTENDTIFSIVDLSGDPIIKDDQTAYFVLWTISSPL